VYVGQNAKVISSVLLSSASIEDGAIVENAIVCSGARVTKGCKVIGKPGKIAVVPENKKVTSDIIISE